MPNRSRLVLPCLGLLLGCSSTKSDSRTSLFGSLSGGAMSKDDSRVVPLFDARPTPEPASSIPAGTLAPMADEAALRTAAPGVWRIGLPAQETYRIVATVLAQSYIIARSDATQYTVATEWDKFFVESRLFRNRVHAAVFPLGPRETELVIRNVVEYYAGDQAQGAVVEDAGWLPCPDVTNEVRTIVGRVQQQVTGMATTGAARDGVY